MTKSRYIVTWSDWDAAKAAAEKRGMPAHGEVGDYVLFEDYDRDIEFSTFDDAVTFALQMHAKDSFGCPRVTRQEYVTDTDDLGNVFPEKHWENVAAWECLPQDPRPTEDRPDIDYSFN